jgi:hypothetical protein
MPPTFMKVFNMHGFDDRESPPWQMVPIDGERYVALLEGDTLAIRSSAPHRVSVQEVGVRDIPNLGPRPTFYVPVRYFRLRGLARGPARVEAWDGQRLVARLHIDTKSPKTLRVTFNFVRDRTGAKTSKVPAEALQWTRELNWIYQQGNVRVICRAARWITVDRDLGWVIAWSPDPGENVEWAAVTAKLDPGADVNVFHFNDVRLGPGVDRQVGLALGRCVMVDDDHPNYVVNIAHEIGHTQGLKDVDDRKPDYDEYALMGKGSGVHLTREDVNTMNP